MFLLPLFLGLIVTSGLHRPNWVCSLLRQLVFLCRDISPSMLGEKAIESYRACLGLVTELARQQNKNGFHVAVGDFWSRAEIIHQATPASDLLQQLRPIDINEDEGGTNITAPLDLATGLCLQAPPQSNENVRWLRPVVLMFSDGEHNTGPMPDEAGRRLREVADLVTVAFGDDADEAILKSLATTPQHFTRCRDGQQLRGYLAAVGSTLSASMTAGTAATDALAGIPKPLLTTAPCRGGRR